MAKFDYELMVQNALRTVVRNALEEVAKDGFSGNHHFYITFTTNRQDVELPDFLRQKHPEEITIILQHQFWDLKVNDTSFSVTLSFADQHHTLTVPLSAIVSFLDPSVKFGLRFIPEEEKMMPIKTGPITDGAHPKDDIGKEGNVVTLDQFRKK